MRAALAVLLLLAIQAGAVTITLTPEQLASIAAQQGGATAPAPTLPPVVVKVPAAAVNLGELQFTGAQLDTQGVGKATPCAYARVVIPSGADGKAASVAVFANGGATAWRQVSVTRAPCDFDSGSLAQGLTATAYLAVGYVRSGAVTVRAGEVWYVNIRNRQPFGGGSSCNQDACDFGVRLYPPS